ncbi:hypothetical protein, partial [uncultured Microbulbifer sp.]|uniref:hypothetical protein n=1 Tax=uncultured Microbulbifer sp. TaxID=348147 RepID=UPI002613CE2D
LLWDFRICQTMRASPAKPGGLPFGLVLTTGGIALLDRMQLEIKSTKASEEIAEPATKPGSDIQ